MSYDEFIQQLAERIDAAMAPSEEGEAILTLGLQDGRKQEVTLALFEEEGARYVRAYTVVGDARGLSQKRLTSALELNSGLLHGAVAVYEGNLILTDTVSLDREGVEQAARVVPYLARMADTFEKMVYGLDRR